MSLTGDYSKVAWPEIKERAETLLDLLDDLDRRTEGFVRKVRKHSDIPEPELATLSSEVHRYCEKYARKIGNLMEELRPRRAKTGREIWEEGR